MRKQSGQIGGYLFGLIFFFIGAGFFYGMVATKLVNIWDMQSWHSADAQLDSATIESYQRRRKNGGYNTMYTVVASYRYQVNGQFYSGTRLRVDTGSSSDRNDFYALLKLLKHEQSRDKKISIWYDPANPSESVYERYLNNWIKVAMVSIFSVVFMMIGCAIIGYAFVIRKNN